MSVYLSTESNNSENKKDSFYRLLNKPWKQKKQEKHEWLIAVGNFNFIYLFIYLLYLR